LDDASDYGAFGSVVNDDRLTRLSYSIEDGGEVAEEGEVVDDEDVGLGDDVSWVGHLPQSLMGVSCWVASGLYPIFLAFFW